MAPHATGHFDGGTSFTSSVPMALPTNGNGHTVEVGNADSDMRMHEGSLELFNLCVQLHKASLLNLVSVGLVDAPCASRIAWAITKAVADHDCPADAESLDYLNFEARMMEVIGPEASLLHLGRSRQDLLSTYSRQILRVRTLAVMKQLNQSRAKIVSVAAEHAETVVPMYTHGVPAQPTTFGHYLLAYAEAFERAHERLAQSYMRLNLSPYGVAVGSTSSFPLDRHYLASLLGFGSAIDNSYGANHVASIDAIQDVVSPLTLLALHVGTVAQDMTTVQATACPWLSSAAPGFVGVSSIMPQKRNPRILEYLRELASEVFGGAHTTGIVAHNCSSGLTDVRETFGKAPLKPAAEMLKLFGNLLDSVHINTEQALYQVSHDYSTVTEVADGLFRAHAVPFRVGHSFASKLVDYGRSQRVGPQEIGYEKAREIYRQVSDQNFPMSAAELVDCLCPTQVVQSRKGFGGPQRAEMARMLDERRKKLVVDETSLQGLVGALEEAERNLDRDFEVLLERTGKK